MGETEHVAYRPRQVSPIDQNGESAPQAKEE